MVLVKKKGLWTIYTTVHSMHYLYIFCSHCAFYSHNTVSAVYNMQAPTETFPSVEESHSLVRESLWSGMVSSQLGLITMPERN